MFNPVDESRAIHSDLVKVIKCFAMDATRRANSGHPGAPMGTGAIASALWTRHMKYDPTHPNWENRDRFVLSCGHASMLLYTMLHLSGYSLTIDDIRNFRQLGSITPGHPEVGVTPGVEATTGPLGTGFATAVGMALAERSLAHRYNTSQYQLVDYNIYVLASDGDIMEGICCEAASFAGHQKLSKIICLYDSNRITIDGSTDLTFSEDVLKRFEAMHWRTAEVDGQDVEAISTAIEQAKSQSEKPTFILCHTHIGEGSPNTQDTPKCHGAPLDHDEIQLTKETLQWKQDEFYVPQKIYDFFEALRERQKEEYARWKETYMSWKNEHPDLAREWQTAPEDISIDENLDEMVLPTQDPIATRSIINTLLKVTYNKVPGLIGGSADLACSVKTEVHSESIISPKEPSGRQIHFGIRENAMGAIMNGLALTRPFRAFSGTFLVFSDFMKPTIRLAALMKLPNLFIYSHDSYAVGEDGPTHQPIEHVMSLRAIPNVTLFRPADIKETIGAWKMAWKRKDGPTIIITTRQKVPVLEQSSRDVSKGAYVLYEPPGAGPLDAYIVATGSEVHLALAVAKKYGQAKKRLRVISMPSWELFEQNDAQYKKQVLPKSMTKSISIEAGITLGWAKYADLNIGLDDFGKSGPFNVLSEEFGFTVEKIISKIDDYFEENERFA